MPLSDAEWLNIASHERNASVGIETDEKLSQARKTALEYYKGEMPDYPAYPNRSAVVSTDLADAVETILPDLIEIFTGGEDVATFTPTGAEDEEGALQETDYINHVFFNENEGFKVLYGMFKDALLLRVGVAKWWWEEDKYEDSEVFADQTDEDLQVLMSMGVEPTQIEQDPETGLYTVTVSRTMDNGCARVEAVPADDFAVAADAVNIKDAVYVCHRVRKRAVELIDLGFDAEKVKELPGYSGIDGEDLRQARDTSGENDESPTGNDGHNLLRRVELHEHYIRYDDDGDGKAEIHRLVTDASDSILLLHDVVGEIPFAVVCPYPTPHRVIGLSLADKIVEVQRIKTALTRTALDSAYFAMNQRAEIAMDQANEYTLQDYLNNVPGAPIRSATGASVRPIAAGNIGFDPYTALEYFSTVSEARTGIVRNAQGLNPDTLHDTARGAQALISAAQKRVRMIARVMAETGLKDLFLGLHGLIRTNGTAAKKARLRGKWVQIDPTSWGSRADMTIEIGVGSGGRDEEAAMLVKGLEVMTMLVQQQGQLGKVFVSPENAYAYLKRFFERGLRFKSADPFLSDPSQQPDQPPQPDPKAMEAQAKLQMEQQKAQGELQLAREKMLAEMELAREKMQLEAQLERERFLAEAQAKAAAAVGAAQMASQGPQIMTPVRMGGAVG